jgi:hypothetical protein
MLERLEQKKLAPEPDQGEQQRRAQQQADSQVG